MNLKHSALMGSVATLRMCGDGSLPRLPRLPPDLVSFGVLMVLAHVLHECANEVERKLILQ
jgi:hypothetical protein